MFFSQAGQNYIVSPGPDNYINKYGLRCIFLLK